MAKSNNSNTHYLELFGLYPYQITKKNLVISDPTSDRRNEIIIFDFFNVHHAVAKRRKFNLKAQVIFHLIELNENSKNDNDNDP